MKTSSELIKESLKAILHEESQDGDSLLKKVKQHTSKLPKGCKVKLEEKNGMEVVTLDKEGMTAYIALADLPGGKYKVYVSNGDDMFSELFKVEKQAIKAFITNINKLYKANGY